MNEERDPYLILGVEKDSTPSEIKFAFRVKAQRNHPDREGGCEKAMADIQWAYSILKDEQRKKHWDCEGFEEVAEPSFSEKATANIMGAFSQWLNGVFTGQILPNTDCVAQLRTAIQNELSKACQGKSQIKNNMGKIDKMLGKFECDNGQYNFFEGHLQSTKEASKRKLLEVETQIKIMEESVEQLKHFSYSPERGLVRVAPPISRTGSATTISY